LHNEGAGDEDHSPDAIRAAIGRVGHEVSYESTKEGAWKRALDEPVDLVAIAGGDGTVAEVLLALAARPGSVATILPLGSANNIALALGLSDRSIVELIVGWPGAPQRAYPLGHASTPDRDELFVEAFGGGLFAETLLRAERIDPDPDDKVDLGLRLLGRLAGELPAQPWRVELDGRDASGDYVAVEVMAIGWTGPNVPLAHEADPHDDLLDVVLVSAADASRIATYLDERIEGGDPDPPPLEVARCRTATLRPPERCALRLDDEAERSRGATWTIAVADTRVALLVP
jgi:diacylglycerol kinase (ATP)